MAAKRMHDSLALLIRDPAYAYFLTEGTFAKPNQALNTNQYRLAFYANESKFDK